MIDGWKLRKHKADLNCCARIAIAVLLGGASTSHAAPSAVDFNRDIRPILSEKCWYCHGQDGNKRQAELRLDVREVAMEKGAIVPNDAEGSELIKRINSHDQGELMPPPSSNRRLSADQKKLLERWIDEGGVYAPHWTFVAPVRPSEPEVKHKDWVCNPIDRFVLAKLETKGLTPSPEADRATLIRRLSIDLVGLPPTPEEVDAFVTDRDRRAYENLVDRLLANPHYGERMALEWLDAARYADSTGFQTDGDTWQWLWRDWVVTSMNQDLPFDQFTIWQLAGDLLPNPTSDQMIASAFNRNHLLNGEGGVIPEEQRFVSLFDRIDTTATTWLGLTMACAQCHDHKYDPITQHDYYGLLDAFNRVPETGTSRRINRRFLVDDPVVELPTEENKVAIADIESQIAATDANIKIAREAAYQGWYIGFSTAGAGLPNNLAAILKKPREQRTSDEQKSLDAALRKLFDEQVWPALTGKLPPVAKLESLKKQLADYKADKVPLLMVMSDAKPRETHILERGNYLTPGEKVSFATPAFLPKPSAGTPTNRLGFAQWLVSPDHPLTARVQVNRLWQHFFGVGLVKTSEDFGVQSEYPTHRELIDWLAVEFRSRGWSMKSMVRLIVTSATYRQSSRMTPELLARDRENRLLARSNRFRMPSMILRDWALAAAGLLDTRIGGVPVYPYQPDQVWEALGISQERDYTYPTSSGTDLFRRSLYTFWRRTIGPANMFDASNRQTCRVRSTPTNTPMHALTTLNDPTWVEAARVLAERSMKGTNDLPGRLTYAFRQVLGRMPNEQELTSLRRAYDNQYAIYKTDNDSAKALLNVGSSKRDESLNMSEHATLSAVCLAIFNLDEALTRE